MQYLWNDFKRGFLYSRKWLLAEIAIAAAVFLLSWKILEMFSLKEPFTWLDLLIIVMYGEEAAEEINMFFFPSRWIALFIPIITAQTLFPYEELHGVGIQFFLRSKSRWNWWCRKCLWLFESVIIFFLCFCLVTALMTVCAGGRLEWVVSGDLLDLFFHGHEITDIGSRLFVILLLMPPTMIYALGMGNMCLMLFLNTGLSYFVTISYLFCGVLWKRWWLLSNYTMLIRYNWETFSVGLDVLRGMEVALGIVMVSFVCGAWKIRRYSFVGKENRY